MKISHRRMKKRILRSVGESYIDTEYIQGWGSLTRRDQGGVSGRKIIKGGGSDQRLDEKGRLSLGGRGEHLFKNQMERGAISAMIACN